MRVHPRSHVDATTGPASAARNRPVGAPSAAPRRRVALAAGLAAAATFVVPAAAPASAAGSAATAATTTSTPSASSAAAAARGNALAVGDVAYVDVAVATLWSSPGPTRRIDRPSLSNPVDLRAWNANMPTTASRAWLSEGSRLETQATLGTRVQVTQVDGAWVKVVVSGQSTPRDARGYPGWLPAAQLVENDAYAARLRRTLHAVVTDETTWLATRASLRGRTTEVSINTELPVLGRTRGAVRVALPDGASRWVDARDVAVRAAGAKPARPTGAQIVATGSRFLGLRYLWAGVSAFGFDCSGFTSTVFKAHGIAIPRDAGPQSTAGRAVARADLRPGDLVFFAGPGGTGRVHHVAIYAGGGRILHSPNSARSVEIVDLRAFDVNREYSGARRYL